MGEMRAGDALSPEAITQKLEQARHDVLNVILKLETRAGHPLLIESVDDLDEGSVSRVDHLQDASQTEWWKQPLFISTAIEFFSYFKQNTKPAETVVKQSERGMRVATRISGVPEGVQLVETGKHVTAEGIGKTQQQAMERALQTASNNFSVHIKGTDIASSSQHTGGKTGGAADSFEMLEGTSSHYLVNVQVHAVKQARGYFFVTIEADGAQTAQ